VRERGTKERGLPAVLRIGGGERGEEIEWMARVFTFIYCDQDLGRDGLLMGLENINRDGSYN